MTMWKKWQTLEELQAACTSTLVQTLGIEFTAIGDEYIEVLTIAQKEQAPLIEVERDIMGIDHQEVGLMIAEKWKLNEVITTCIGKHHNVGDLNGPLARQVAFVALGNIYTNILDIGFAGNPFPAETEMAHLLKVLDISAEDFGHIGEGVQEEIRKAEIFLQI